MFGNLREIIWVSKIPLSGEREKNISYYFQQSVDFKYPQTIDEFNMHLTFLRERDT